jgi:hypothetical protein
MRGSGCIEVQMARPIGLFQSRSDIALLLRGKAYHPIIAI